MPRALTCSILPRCCPRPSLLLRPTPPSTRRTVRCRNRRLYPLPFRLTCTAQRRANSEQILDIGQNLGNGYAEAPARVSVSTCVAFLRVYFPFSVRAPNDAALPRPGFRYPETSVHTLLQFLRIPCPPGFHSDREFCI